MSVAIGIAQPETVSVPLLNSRKIIAGTIAPPMAHKIGNKAFLGDDSSPSTISRLISSHTKRKNRAIKPSFIHKETEYFRWIDSFS
jgi:hypothetical protein